MITHYMLENSRAIRVEWSLRELGLEHETKCYKRVNGKKAPPEMKGESGTTVGKSPALRDGDLLIVESSAILTYVTTCGADGSEVGFGTSRKNTTRAVDFCQAWAGTGSRTESILSLGSGLPKAVDFFQAWAGTGSRTESILSLGSGLPKCVELCCRYLAENYDESGRLFPGLGRVQDRVDTFAWVGFAEGALMAHALPITYAAWFIPDEYEKAHQGFHDSLKPNVINDLNYLEAELEKKVERFRKKNGQGAFLVGQDLTIADIQVALPIEYIFTHPTISKELKDEIRGYTQIKVWLRGLEARSAYKEATKVAECLCFA
ncbi:BQ5605_C017g08536 [Microbotryum silenes-dioicae]|uniref:BQ5605_C017g08536 protein n=1 Tax=Microbotryum silenes-dioicae TaxID=796604 RepID=A0A2X0LYZ8_9BASI|nr:BQ5605_C017g08536 [Microbotryum silenes-dioicae]